MDNTNQNPLQSSNDPMDVEPAKTNENAPPEDKILIPVHSNSTQKMISSELLKNIIDKQKKTIENQNQEDSKSEYKPEEIASTKVKIELEQWKTDNDYVRLEVLTLKDSPEYHISFVIGPDSTPFEMYANENWQPLFLTSESPQLEEYLTPINTQIEEQSVSSNPMTITHVLNIFALSFKDKNSRTNVGLQPTIHRNTFHDFTPTPTEPEAPPKIPTQEEWNDLIFPEIRRALAKENFQPYEIDEWIRRVQVQLQRKDYAKALTLIQTDIFGGISPPDSIVQFFLRGRYGGHRSYSNEDYMSDMIPKSDFMESSVNPALNEFLREQIKELRKKDFSTKELGFTANPIGNDLYLWNIRIFGLGEETKLGRDLMEFTLKNTKIFDHMKQLEPDILLEMKFPNDFPNKPPLFRVIRPRFKNTEEELTQLTKSMDSLRNSGLFQKSTPSNQDRSSISVSRVLERNFESEPKVVEPMDVGNDASTTSIVDIAQRIRAFFLDPNSNVEVDLENPLENFSLPTVGNFWRTFQATTPQQTNRNELENGGKIVLPMSVLEDLSHDDYEGPVNISSPFTGGHSVVNSNPIIMIFELSTGNGKRSFCGVEEFTADEGQVIVPQWILNNIQASKGSDIDVRRVTLPKGNYVKLQPHNAEFLEVNDTKAMLEWVLPKFVVMSVGDTIVVPYRNKKYPFTVLEVKPGGKAIHLIDSDVTTEFAPPLTGDPYSNSSSSSFSSVGINIPITNDSISNTKMSTTPSNHSSSPNTSSTPSKNIMGTTPPGNASGRVESGVEGVDFKMCDNCKQKIPLGVYTTHSLSCARINWHCAECNMVVQKSKKDEHMQEYHSVVFCECGESMESRLLQNHKTNNCPKRIVRCEYCPLEMPYVEKFEHEKQCGSQTEMCEKCGRYIQKRDLLVHVVSCDPTKPSSYGSSPARNFTSFTNFPVRSYNSPPEEVKKQEDVMLCPICMTPFMQFDDLEVHLLEQHGDSYGDHNMNTQ